MRWITINIFTLRLNVYGINIYWIFIKDGKQVGNNFFRFCQEIKKIKKKESWGMILENAYKMRREDKIKKINKLKLCKHK